MTHKCSLLDTAPHAYLHLESMLPFPVHSKKQGSYIATFIRRESSQSQPGHKILLSISGNENILF